MRINIINKLEQLVEDEGWSFFWGTRAQRNTELEWGPITILIQPFGFPLTRGTEYRVKMSIWIFKEQPIDSQTINNTIELESVQEIANTFYNKLLESNWATPLVSKQNLRVTFWPSDGNKTTNSESAGFLSFDIKIWDC